MGSEAGGDLKAVTGDRTRLDVVVGDITRQEVDAIVNAANHTLLGGGGVDGAIHRAAGPGLLKECRTLGGCPTGSCKITAGHRLKARHVIHCVGPVWHGGGADEDGLLAGCYRTALELAAGHRLSSIAFPAISTGVYGFPLERAARVAVAAVRKTLADTGDGAPDLIRFVCFNDDAGDVYRRVLAEER